MRTIAPALALVIGLLDVALFVMTIVDSRAATIFEMTTWQYLFTLVAVVYAMWACFFYVDSLRWSLSHYDSYRRLLTAHCASALFMVTNVWLAGTSRRAALVAYPVLFMLRAVPAAGALAVWLDEDLMLSDVAQREWLIYTRVDLVQYDTIRRYSRWNRRRRRQQQRRQQLQLLQQQHADAAAVAMARDLQPRSYYAPLTTLVVPRHE